jgi:predicted nucleic acid-binding protein
MYLIDTDVLSELRRPRPDQTVLSWMHQRREIDLFLSAITVMEIERGIQKQRRVNPEHAVALEAWLMGNFALFGNRILAVTSNIARRWGRLQIELGRDDDDLAIAATAIEYGFSVVTRNARHFDKTGADVVNPFEPRLE